MGYETACEVRIAQFPKALLPMSSLEGHVAGAAWETFSETTAHEMGSRPWRLGAPMASIAALALALSACGVTAHTSNSRPFSHGKQPLAGNPHANEVAIQEFPLRAEGLAGGYAWYLSATSGLYVSSDSGTTWQSQPLPSDLQIGAVTDVRGSAQGDLWVTTTSHSGFTLYSKVRGAATWSGTSVNVNWPADADGAVTPSALIVPGGGSTLGVIVERPPSFTGGDISTLFLSSDDGKTFAPQASLPAMGAWDLEMASTTNVVAVRDNAMGDVYYTTDGGVTWARSDLGADSQATDLTLGQPTSSDGDVYLAARIATNGTDSYHLLKSTDGGASFSDLGTAGSQGPGASGVPPAGTPAVAVGGNDVWLAPEVGGVVYVSEDGGGTWSTVTIPGFSGEVHDISLQSQTHASVEGTMAAPGCSGGAAKAPICASQAYVLSTVNSGKTWLSQPLAPSTAAPPAGTTAPSSSTTP